MSLAMLFVDKPRAENAHTSLVAHRTRLRGEVFHDAGSSLVYLDILNTETY